MIDGLSFAAFLRIATMIVVPASRGSAMEIDLHWLGRSGGCAAF